MNFARRFQETITFGLLTVTTLIIALYINSLVTTTETELSDLISSISYTPIDFVSYVNDSSNEPLILISVDEVLKYISHKHHSIITKAVEKFNISESGNRHIEGKLFTINEKKYLSVSIFSQLTNGEYIVVDSTFDKEPITPSIVNTLEYDALKDEYMTKKRSNANMKLILFCYHLFLLILIITTVRFFFKEIGDYRYLLHEKHFTY